MQFNDRSRPRILWRWNSVAPWAALLAFAVSAIPAAASPFAYVVNGGNVSVIDTATNGIVATIPIPTAWQPCGIAVSPDGKHAYTITPNDINFGGPSPNIVSVIDTATNTVATTIEPGPGEGPGEGCGIAVSAGWRRPPLGSNPLGSPPPEWTIRLCDQPA
jgi:YVTN family beta-propeller protein